ncbi:MAG TPA: LuxR C-terminal-related transcriptional regulator [Gammaproteobacteria bacterium]|nr:LuxR C-terminal-related transcriptional regulator [Gammaproteobacteria bacterium]
MNTLGEVFTQSTDAVFGIDAAGRIRFANAAFGRLLGYPCQQVRGTWCAEVLCGADLNGQAFCGRHCPIPKTAAGRPSISDFDLVVKRADGDQVLVNIGASYIPPHLREQAGQVDVFFSLRQVQPRRLLQRIAMSPVEATAKAGTRRHGRLTSREKEILGLATQGMKTTQIACRLSVSTQTVRTHFKNIYPKLGVNSRTEAVIFAMQHGLH